MNILYILLICFFLYLFICDLLKWFILKHYIGFIPNNWNISIKDQETIIIHHNGLRSSYCIDEGDNKIDFHNELNVGKLVVMLLKIF